jgi:hypothetical protein
MPSRWTCSGPDMLPPRACPGADSRDDALVETKADKPKEDWGADYSHFRAQPPSSTPKFAER